MRRWLLPPWGCSMRWLDSWLNRAAPAWMGDAEYRRVVLPRLTRPNLVARLYMLFTAMSNAGIGWGIPTSATAKIMESGGMVAHFIVASMTLATVFGLLDVIANDVLDLQRSARPDGLIGRFAAWLEWRRTARCFLIGGCYLILAFATHGSPVSGTGWLLLYYLQMTLCAGLLGWSLRALMHATVVGSRDAA